MELRNYFRIIGHYWWLVLLTAIVAGAAAAAIDYYRTPVYTTQARVALSPAPVVSDTRTLVDLVGQIGSRYIPGTFAEAFSSSDVISDARKSVGLSETAAQDYKLNAVVLPDTAVIEVTGTGPDPNVLARYLNATLDATINNTHNLFDVIELVTLEPARVPAEPTAPQPVRDLITAVAVGLGTGLLLALLFDYLRAPAPAHVVVAPARVEATRASPFMKQ
jgi:capsular polysaccharide biosynthesis protein